MITTGQEDSYLTPAETTSGQNRHGITFVAKRNIAKMLLGEIHQFFMNNI